jgi:hypothetical protein
MIAVLDLVGVIEVLPSILGMKAPLLGRAERSIPTARKGRAFRRAGLTAKSACRAIMRPCQEWPGSEVHDVHLHMPFGRRLTREHDVTCTAALGAGDEIRGEPAIRR